MQAYSLHFYPISLSYFIQYICWLLSLKFVMQHFTLKIKSYKTGKSHAKY